MYEADLPIRFRGLRRLARAGFLSLLMTLLLADLPLALLHGLQAELRYLTRFPDGPRTAPVSELYDTGTLPRSVAINVEPVAALQSRAANTAKTGSTVFAAFGSTLLPDPGWRIARGVPPRDETVDFRPPRRAYDPLGPPSPLHRAAIAV